MIGAAFVKQLSGLVQSTSASPMERQGSSGTAIYGGYIQEKDINAALTGRQKYITYSDILVNTSIVGAGVRYFLNLVAKASWTVQPADDSTQAQEIADFIQEALDDMNTPWARVVRRAAMYKFYGFSIQEWIAKRREDGRIGFLDVEPRPQQTIERWDRVDGEIIGVVQRAAQDSSELYLPREKIVYMVDDSISDSPEGLGIFRNIVAIANRLTRFEQLEGFGFETDLRGVPVARAPIAALKDQQARGLVSKTEYQQALAPIENFIRNHIKNPSLGVILDSSVHRDRSADARPSSTPTWDLQLLRGDPTTQPEIARAIERLNHEIARLIGVEQILLGSDGRGTQALSRDKSHNLFLIIDSTLNELAETFEKDLVLPLMQMNGMDVSLRPNLKTEAVQFRDVEQIAAAVRDLATAGVPLTPGSVTVGEIFDLLGLTRPETLDETFADFEPETPSAPDTTENIDELPSGMNEDENNGTR